jgi:hypothetical protein
MVGSRAWTIGVLPALAFITISGALAEGDDVMMATIAKPATISATTTPPGDNSAMSATATARRRIILSVSEFQPAADADPVTAVVKLQKADGAQQEIGRFGITPHVPFKARDSSNFQRFGFSLPPDYASSGALTVIVSLVPNRGEGAGARLKIGDVKIE